MISQNARARAPLQQGQRNFTQNYGRNIFPLNNRSGRRNDLRQQVAPYDFPSSSRSYRSQGAIYTAPARVLQENFVLAPAANRTFSNSNENRYVRTHEEQLYSDDDDMNSNEMNNDERDYMDFSDYESNEEEEEVESEFHPRGNTSNTQNEKKRGPYTHYDLLDVFDSQQEAEEALSQHMNFSRIRTSNLKDGIKIDFR